MSRKVSDRPPSRASGRERLRGGFAANAGAPRLPSGDGIDSISKIGDAPPSVPQLRSRLRTLRDLPAELRAGPARSIVADALLLQGTLEQLVDETLLVAGVVERRGEHRALPGSR